MPQLVDHQMWGDGVDPTGNDFNHPTSLGASVVYSQLLDTLKQEGLEPINAKGQKFDPYMHEVMLKEKSDKPSDTVIEELQKGYMLKDKIIRHSKVKISE